MNVLRSLEFNHWRTYWCLVLISKLFFQWSRRSCNLLKCSESTVLQIFWRVNPLILAAVLFFYLFLLCINKIKATFLWKPFQANTQAKRLSVLVRLSGNRKWSLVVVESFDASHALLLTPDWFFGFSHRFAGKYRDTLSLRREPLTNGELNCAESESDSVSRRLSFMKMVGLGKLKKESLADRSSQGPEEQSVQEEAVEEVKPREPLSGNKTNRRAASNFTEHQMEQWFNGCQMVPPPGNLWLLFQSD